MPSSGSVRSTRRGRSGARAGRWSSGAPRSPRTTAWGAPGFDAIAGLQFRITNRGDHPLRAVYLGLLADLDSRRREDKLGAFDDRVTRRGAVTSFNAGRSSYTATNVGFSGSTPTAPAGPTDCMRSIGQSFVVLSDGGGDPALPAVAVVPLDHTTD